MALEMSSDVLGGCTNLARKDQPFMTRKTFYETASILKQGKSVLRLDQGPPKSRAATIVLQCKSNSP